MPYRGCFINPSKTLEAYICRFARPEGLRGFEICTTTAASRIWPATTRSYIPSSAVCTPPPTTTGTIIEPFSVLALEKEMRDDLTVLPARTEQAFWCRICSYPYAEMHWPIWPPPMINDPSVGLIISPSRVHRSGVQTASTHAPRSGTGITVRPWPCFAIFIWLVALPSHPHPVAVTFSTFRNSPMSGA